MLRSLVISSVNSGAWPAAFATLALIVVRLLLLREPVDIESDAHLGRDPAK
jgi:hypothetical protein